MYKTTADWDVSTYCGITLKWDYANRTVELSIPEYVCRALICFNHPAPSRPQHSPHPWTAPKFGKHPQLATVATDTPLSTANRQWVEEFVSTFLYYARTIDTEMRTLVSSIGAAKISNDIKAIQTRINHFLDYAATHPNAKLKYIASGMCLWAHPDASYLCETKGHSRAGAYVNLSSKPQSLPIR
jgi:hypothetical protein